MEHCPDCGTLVNETASSCESCGSTLSHDPDQSAEELLRREQSRETDTVSEPVSRMGAPSTVLLSAILLATTPLLLGVTLAAGVAVGLSEIVFYGWAEDVVTFVLSFVPTALAYRYAFVWATDRDDDDAPSVALQRLPSLLLAVLVWAVPAVIVAAALSYLVVPPFGDIVGLGVVLYSLVRVAPGFASIVVDGYDPVEGLKTGWTLSRGLERKLAGILVIPAVAVAPLVYFADWGAIVGIVVEAVTMVSTTVGAAAVGRVYVEERTAEAG